MMKIQPSHRHLNKFYELCQFIFHQKHIAKGGVLRSVQQPGSYWDMTSVLTLLGLEPIDVTAYD